MEGLKVLDKKPTILIGSLNKKHTGPIDTIAKAFLEGLKTKYDMIPHYADRKYGLTGQSKLNLMNFYYFLKHLFLWLYGLNRYRPDIAHYPITSYWNLEKSITFLKVARCSGAKTLGHLHGGSFDIFWANLSARRKTFAQKELNKLDALVVLSDYWKHWACDNIGLSLDKVMVVNNPIDSKFEKKALQFEPQLASPDIFFIGSLGTRKGIYDILKVASRLNKLNSGTYISIAGPAENPKVLNDIETFRQKDRLVNLKILGPLYGEDKINYFQGNGIFLFPSYNENFPLVIIEAAAAGKAIVTTQVGALPEFFEHNRSVIFVEPGNIEEITKALINLIEDKTLRINLGETARKVFMKKLSRDRIVNSLDLVYQQLLTAQGTSTPCSN